MIRQTHCKREVDTRLSQSIPDSKQAQFPFLENGSLHPGFQINSSPKGIIKWFLPFTRRQRESLDLVWQIRRALHPVGLLFI